MAENKTKETLASVEDFINKVADETKRKDSFSLVKLIQKETGFKPKMWGPSIIGFGSYHYKYETGREGDMPIVGFSPRSSAIVLYLSLNEVNREKLLPKFGKHTTGSGCIYVKKLADVNMDVLKEMIATSVKNKSTE